MTTKKSPAERSIEALTWASVVIWLGFMLVARALDQTWLIMMVLGIILLSSAIYQRSRQWDTSLSIWIFGIWMAVFSVIETVNMLIESMNEGAGLDIDLSVYLGIALVSMGVAAILRNVQGPSTSARRADAYHTGGAAVGDPRPQMVTDHYGSGDYGVGPREYRPGREWQQDAGYLEGSRYGTGSGTRQQTPARQNEPDWYIGPEDQRVRGEYDQYDAPPAQRYDQGYEGPTQHAGYDDRAYESRPQPPEGYDYAQAQYNPDHAQQYGQYDPYDDYYDDPQWDEPPQVERPPQPRRRPPQPPQDRSRRETPNDLDARVQDIIRRSRERRNLAPDDEDLPY